MDAADQLAVARKQCRRPQIPGRLTLGFDKGCRQKLSTRAIVNLFYQLPAHGQNRPSHGNATRCQIVDPIDFALNQRCATAQTVTDAQNGPLGRALEGIDEILHRFERLHERVRNAISLHGFLQNGRVITIFDRLFHVP